MPKSAAGAPALRTHDVISLSDGRGSETRQPLPAGRSGATPKDSGKQSKVNVEARATSRISSPDYSNLSRRTPLDKGYVESQSVRALEREFPVEYSSFKAMKGRERAGACVVHPDIRTFKSFLLNLPRCPGAGYTLDRIDTFDHEYAPGKLRWATKQEQANNRPNTILLPYEGQLLPLTDVAALTGQRAGTMRQHLRRGWSAEEVVAGKRLSPEAPPIVTPEGWPPGITPNLWEGPFQGWRKHPRLDDYRHAATRAVFFLWIGNNIRDVYLARLEQAFPHIYDPECTDPNEDSPCPPELEAHRAYQSERRLKLMLDQVEALVGDDPAQRDLLRSLRRLRRKIVKQRDAREAMSAFSPYIAIQRMNRKQPERR